MDNLCDVLHALVDRAAFHTEEEIQKAHQIIDSVAEINLPEPGEGVNTDDAE